jgi:hypothetical protein
MQAGIPCFQLKAGEGAALVLIMPVLLQASQKTEAVAAFQFYIDRRHLPDIVTVFAD